MRDSACRCHHLNINGVPLEDRFIPLVFFSTIKYNAYFLFIYLKEHVAKPFFKPI